MKNLCVLFLVTLLCLPCEGDPVPAIARIAGVNVGETTMEALDQRLGPAQVSIGGHARGVHEWRSRQTGWGPYTDGFYYNGEDGRVLDSVSVYREGRIDLPATNLPRRQMLFMGKISLGMRRKEVERQIQAGLPPPSLRAADRIVWKVAGSQQVGRHRITNWKAELQFKHSKLDGIEVDAEYE